MVSTVSNRLFGTGTGTLTPYDVGLQTNEMRVHVSMHVEEMRKGYEKMTS